MESSPKLLITNRQFGIELESNIELDDFPTETLIEGWNVKDEHCGSEIVSPILRGYTGLMAIRTQLGLLHETLVDSGDNIVGFEDCGLHVHVDIQNFVVGDLKRLLALASKFDDVIFSLMPERRRENDYCDHLNYTDDEIDSCNTLREFQALQGNEKYFGTNIMSFQKYGTVEFRYAAATFDWRIIYSLVSLYLRMVSFAKSRLPIPIYHRGSVADGKELLCKTLGIRGAVKQNIDYMYDMNNKYYDDGMDPEEFLSKFPVGLSRKKVTK